MSKQKEKIQAISELERLLSDLPEVVAIKNQEDAAVQWNAVLGSVLKKVKKTPLSKAYDSIYRATDKPGPAGLPQLPGPDHYRKKLRSSLVHVIQELKYDCKEHGSSVLTAGAVYDYFDEIRQKVELGKSDIFFVDAYLDADFIGKYMPFVQNSASVRLLTTNKKTSIQAAAAAKTFSSQHGVKIVTRQSAESIHDRWLIVDHKYCYQSGASFKDGATKSNTTITESIDIAKELVDKYQGIWDQSTDL